MFACVDVDYRSESGPAVAACVVFSAWHDSEPAAEYVITVDQIEPYVPGEFYRRELPCILAVLDQVAEALDAIVVDGHVWLDGEEQAKGLGAHLHAALDGAVPIIGVAKNRYHTSSSSAELRRGIGGTPLYVTAIGMSQSVALGDVASMHGPYRVPTLLRRVDALCRTA